MTPMSKQNPGPDQGELLPPGDTSAAAASPLPATAGRPPVRPGRRPLWARLLGRLIEPWLGLKIEPEQLQQLDADFAFVAQCNEGGEFMAPEHIARIQALAQRTWRRTLSDRIGISHEEQQRKQAMAEVELPTQEPLLADRADHLFARGPRDILKADNAWGFKVNVPEHLYNRGELYNLSIGRGTLARFEEETGVRVIYDTFESNEEMVAKLVAANLRRAMKVAMPRPIGGTMPAAMVAAIGA